MISTSLVFATAGFLLATASLASAKTLSLVIVSTRHGERNPSQYLKDDPNVGQWGQEGINQLNKYGKIRQYALGQAIRARYPPVPGYENFLSDQWDPNEFTGTSSDAERCQDTLQMIAAGLYPPKDWAIWNSNLLWQPVPYSIDSTLLRAYNLKCPAVINAWKPPNEGGTDHGAELIKKYKAYMDLAAEKEGLKTTLSDLADVADNIRAIKERGLPLPSWINDTTYDILSQFAEAPQVGCAEFKDCRRLMAGHWVNKIFKTMEEKQNKPSSPKKFYLYTTHNEILSSLFWIFGVKVDGVPFGTGAIIEYSVDDGGALRLFKAIPKDTPAEINFEYQKICDQADQDGWCPVATVKALVQPMLIENIDVECPPS